jgi:hypothetical protein
MLGIYLPPQLFSHRGLLLVGSLMDLILDANNLLANSLPYLGLALFLLGSPASDRRLPKMIAGFQEHNVSVYLIDSNRIGSLFVGTIGSCFSYWQPNIQT